MVRMAFFYNYSVSHKGVSTWEERMAACVGKPSKRPCVTLRLFVRINDKKRALVKW